MLQSLNQPLCHFGFSGFGAATWTAANSFNLGRNSGITITAPAAAGSGGGYVIGS
jgi:hypothetical protein